MYEIRIYRVDGKNKTRTAKIKSPLGFIAWCRLWSTLKKYSVKH